MKARSQRLKDVIVSQIQTELRDSSFFQVEITSVLDKINRELSSRRIEAVICYGLGSFHSTTDLASRYQLALLLLIHRYLEKKDSGLSSEIEIYDPFFQQADIDALASFSHPRFKIIERNELCARKLDTIGTDQCTLFYMPHLESVFYNNLLGINWNSNNLRQLIVFGNSFRNMIERDISRSRMKELYYVNCLVNNFRKPLQPTKKKDKRKKNNIDLIDAPERLVALLEFSIDDSTFNHTGIFNELSIHMINDTWLTSNATTINENQLANWSCDEPAPDRDDRLCEQLLN